MVVLPLVRLKSVGFSFLSFLRALGCTGKKQDFAYFFCIFFSIWGGLGDGRVVGSLEP